MFGLGAPELIVILVIIIVLFGSTKIPKLARSLGEARRELKDGWEGKDKKDDEKKAS